MIIKRYEGTSARFYNRLGGFGDARALVTDQALGRAAARPTLGAARGLTFRMRTGGPTGAVALTKTLGAGITVAGVFNEDPRQNTQQVSISVAAADQAGMQAGTFYWTLERADGSGYAPLFAGAAVANPAA